MTTTIEHILQHDVTSDEVEEVFDRKPVIRKGRQKSYLAYGISDFDRHLLIVFKYLGRKRVRPITAREMTAKEKRFYKLIKR